MLELYGALRAIGPATLLWVVLADSDHASGTVEVVKEGLLKGYMDHFAPLECANSFSTTAWTKSAEAPSYYGLGALLWVQNSVTPCQTVRHQL